MLCLLILCQPRRPLTPPVTRPLDVAAFVP
jgi:hypothetical protein